MPTETVLQLRTAHADFYGTLRGLNSKVLREQGGALAKEIRTLADKIGGEKREFTAEEEVAWRKVNAHYDLTKAEWEEAEDPSSPRNSASRIKAIEEDMRRPARGSAIARGNAFPRVGSDGTPDIDNDRMRALAISAWVQNKDEFPLSEEQKQACKTLGVRPTSKSLKLKLSPTHQIQALQRRFRGTRHELRDQFADMPLPEFGATLSGQSGPVGGYLVPPETLLRSLEINLLYYGGMRQVSETIRTASGERMSWPTADDTTNTGVQLGENTTIGSSTDPTFGKVYWDAYKFSSKPVLVPYELLQDSVFNLPGVLGEMLGIRLGRITNTKYTTGTGAATPKGIITAATTYTASSSTAIFADDLLGLIHSIDPAYRQQVGNGFMMHDSVVLAIRKLKDGIGNYMWMSGLQSGTPDRLLSYPFTINQDMDSTFASGKNTVLFGLLSHYKIRTVGEMRLYRLQERYRDLDQDAFLAFIREDGNLLTAGTAPVKVLHHT